MIFKKCGSSYVHIDLLLSSSKGKINARLYDLNLDLTSEFIFIISKNQTQFIYESNSFHFITYLDFVGSHLLLR